MPQVSNTIKKRKSRHGHAVTRITLRNTDKFSPNSALQTIDIIAPQTARDSRGGPRVGRGAVLARRHARALDERAQPGGRQAGVRQRRRQLRQRAGGAPVLAELVAAGLAAHRVAVVVVALHEGEAPVRGLGPPVVLAVGRVVLQEAEVAPQRGGGAGAGAALVPRRAEGALASRARLVITREGCGSQKGCGGGGGAGGGRRAGGGVAAPSRGSRSRLARWRRCRRSAALARFPFCRCSPP